VYRSGGECCGGSIPGQNISVSRVTSAMGRGFTVIATGALRGRWGIGRTLSVCAETIFLQQSCLWFAGLHDMVRQHFIVCSSVDIHAVRELRQQNEARRYHHSCDLAKH
jgi:hypothetical protein